MITGKVTPSREAVVEIEVSAPGGSLHCVEVVLDTGFTGHLTLPPHQIAVLQLPVTGVRSATLGDGTTVAMKTFRANVLWHGQNRQVLVLEADGSPLIGMDLLHGSRLTIDVVNHGDVTIDELP